MVPWVLLNQAKGTLDLSMADPENHASDVHVSPAG